MRRIPAALIVSVLLIALLIASAAVLTAPTTTPTPTSTPTILPPTSTPSQAASPTPDLIALQATASAYATEYADALGELTVSADVELGIRPCVSFSESELNVLLEPYAAEIDDVRNVVIDLTPGGGALTADLMLLGMAIPVHSTAQIYIEAGVLQIDVAGASIGGISLPQAAIDAANDQLVDIINRAIHDGLSEYGSAEQLTLTSAELTDTMLIIEFLLPEISANTPPHTPVPVTPTP